MSPADENKTPSEKFAELVQAETKAKLIGGGRPSQNLKPTIHEAFAIADEVVKPVEEKVEKVERGLKRNNWGSVVAGILVVGAIAGGVMSAQKVAADKTVEVAVPMISHLREESAATKERLDFFKDEFKRHLADESELHRVSRREHRLQAQDIASIQDALNVPRSKRAKREVDEE